MKENGKPKMGITNLAVSVEDERWTEALPDIEDISSRVLRAAREYLHLQAAAQEVSVLLTNNAVIQDLNARYRDKNRPTNVLSFPQDEPYLLGDIILAYETVKKEAKAQNKTLQDHFSHLLIHGFLHLLGYDHIGPEEAKTMEGLEIEICKALNVKNPYDIDGQTRENMS